MRGISNPPNPFESQHRELLEPAAHARVDVFEDATREILSRNDSPDLPFRWSVNPYRGCFHACAYCYARSSHEYWGFGAGTDFESKLIVKPNAADLLRKAFLKPSWKGEFILFSGNTDCYQPLEATYGLTRACLEVCADFQNPVGIITKSALVMKDLDLLATLHQKASIRVFFSIPFSDAETARKVEPHVPSPEKRFAAMKLLADAGIPTGISIAPVIPGLNEDDIPDLLMRARAAGAVEAVHVLLRLSGSVEPVFLERMAAAFPDRIGKITNRVREVRGGRLSEGEFFKRYEGTGPHWELIQQLFEVSRRKAGFPDRHDDHSIPNTFRRPRSAQIPEQTTLF
jgi:DNA repair photolyase